MPPNNRRDPPPSPGIFTLDGRDVSDDARTQEAAEPAEQVYDSMEALVGRDDDVIELYDINAAMHQSGADGHSVPMAGSSIPLSTRAHDAPREPSFDGVVDGSATQVDGGRALLMARHQQTRQSLQPLVEEVGLELPANALAPGLLALSAPNHPALSQFRQLKIKVEGIIDQLRYRSLAIMSACPREGRTTTALNLGIVMSENPWLKVALLDLNFRKPDLGHLMRVPDGDPGLLHVLSGRCSLDAALRKLEGRNLYLLHTGGLYDNSMSVLNSPQFDVFLNRLYEAFDLVIIDAPPALSGDDALVIKQKVDGVLLVFRAESTSVNDMNRAVGRLGRERILGVVLNGVAANEVQ